MTGAPPENEPATRPTTERPLADRRVSPTPMVSRYLFIGRRRSGRRDGETERVYVDRPGPWAVTAFALVTGLSVLDAFLTLDLLSRGGKEANPVMLAALSLGNGPFVFLKTGVTVLGAGFLSLHKNWPLGRVCLWIAVGFYAALTAWHLIGPRMLGI